MGNLAIFVALGWFWLTFYSVGPLTSWTQLAVGAVSLLVACLASAVWGVATAARRCPR